MCLIQPRTKQNSLYVENPLDKAFPIKVASDGSRYRSCESLFKKPWIFEEMKRTARAVREVWGGK